MSLNLALIGQEAGIARGEVYGQRSGPDRREWWSVQLGRTLQSDHPLRLPAGAYGARSAVGPPLSRWLGVPVLPSRYTHPVPYPIPRTQPVHLPVTRTTPVTSTTGTCTYGRF